MSRPVLSGRDICRYSDREQKRPEWEKEETDVIFDGENKKALRKKLRA